MMVIKPVLKASWGIRNRYDIPKEEKGSEEIMLHQMSVESINNKAELLNKGCFIIT